MTLLNFELLIAFSLIGYIAYEVYVEEIDPFQPVLQPFDDVEPLDCFPATQGSGFTEKRYEYAFKITRHNILIGTTSHHWWSFIGKNLADCQRQMRTQMKLYNNDSARYHWEFTHKDKPSKTKLVNITTNSSTLGTPYYCNRNAWDLSFYDE
jgi:hypothetical protein